MITRFCLLAFLCLSCATHTHASTAAVVWNNPVAFTEPGLTHHHFRSASMDIEVGYSVWLPPGYESSQERYPVIYFLHGSGGTESADAPSFSRFVAERVASGAVPAAICVFPNGGLSGYRDHPETKINVESMIIRELLPRIDQDYRTVAERRGRVIAGFSMGGAGAVCLSLKFPELFSSAASWAGGFAHEDGGKLVPFFDTAPLLKPSSLVRLLLIVGYDDLTYPWHAPILAGLQGASYPFTLRTIDHLGHDLGRYYELTGDQLLEFLTADFAGPRRSPSKAH